MPEENQTQPPPGGPADPASLPGLPAASDQPDRPAAPAATADAPGRGGARARQYAERRRGWIGEHARDDRFLIFVGVTVTVALLSFIGYKLVTDWHSQKALTPVPLAELLYGQAEETAPGVVRVEYNFDYDRTKATPREACPNLADWVVSGAVDSQGILVCGEAVHRPFYEPGELSVECDAALITGAQLTLFLRSIYDNSEGDGYRLDLTASGQPDWPATAQLSRYEDGTRRTASRPASLPGFRARRDPPLFFRVKLEMSGGTVRAFFGKTREDLREVASLPVEDHLGAGKVTLTGELSHTAFDNVVITGRPHKDFVAWRTRLHRLFGAPRDEPEAGAPPAGAEAETGAPR